MKTLHLPEKDLIDIINALEKGMERRMSVMFIVTSFSQMEEAMRYEVNEILLLGQVATIVHEALHTRIILTEQFGQRYTKTLLVLARNFDILNFRSTENNSCLLLGRILQNTNGENSHD